MPLNGAVRDDGHPCARQNIQEIVSLRITGDEFNDVWSSSNGSSWTETTTAALWPIREDFACAAYNGQLVVIAGWSYENDAVYNDVYHSPDGVNWTASTYSAPFGIRAGIRGAVKNNQMWIFDGWNDAETFNDVWYAPPTPPPTLTPTNTPGGDQGNVKRSPQQGLTPTPTLTPTYSPAPSTPAANRLLVSAAAAPNISRDGEPVRFLFSLGQPAWVEVSVFTLTGERVFQASVEGNAGTNTVEWPLQNSSDSAVASGLYIYRLKADDGVTQEVKLGKLIVLH